MEIKGGNFDENHGIISVFLFLAQPEGKLCLLQSESITSSFIFQAPSARKKVGGDVRLSRDDRCVEKKEQY